MKKTSTSTPKVAAHINVRRAADMTKHGRKRVADWLRKAADDLEKSGHNYSARFINRYWYKGN